MKKSTKLKERILQRGADAIQLVNESAEIFKEFKKLQKDIERVARALDKVKDNIDNLELEYIDALEAEGDETEVCGSFTEGLSEAEVNVSDDLYFDEDVRTFTPQQQEQVLSRTWKYFVEGAPE